MATIADIVLDNSGGEGLEAFDILLAALQAIDPNQTGVLGAAFDPNENLTVFAPTDQAFIDLAKVIDPTVTDETDAINVLVGASAALSPVDNPTAFLEKVVSYHISPGEKSKAEVQAEDKIDTLAGLNIKPSGEMLGDKEPDLADPTFDPSLTDLTADNGVVHVIDKVLLPFDIHFNDGGLLAVGNGNDAVIGSELPDVIVLGKGHDVANGGGSIDIIKGNGGRDVLNGGDGNDFLHGGRKKDFLAGNDGDDNLFGNRGKDDLSGGDGNDFGRGGRGKDTVKGDDGNDHLFGGRAKDILVGGSGDDFLKGGSGADKFVFNPNNLGDSNGKAKALEGDDVVADFNIAEGDKLVLDMSSFDQGTIDSLAATSGDLNELELIDLIDANVVTLGASNDGDLLIGHPVGTIELNGIPSDVDPAALIPAVKFNFDTDFV
ncbi:fasciclin domain-containing protein [Bauldia sp.]|uniref:fasciclin domain-containing protein n=1 Tax=Bauldia sp. TaxID=2575872 RepID=UPI003BAA12B3